MSSKVNCGQYHAPDGDWDGMQAWGVCPACEKVCIGLYGRHYGGVPRPGQPGGHDARAARPVLASAPHAEGDRPVVVTEPKTTFSPGCIGAQSRVILVSEPKSRR